MPVINFAFRPFTVTMAQVVGGETQSTAEDLGPALEGKVWIISAGLSSPAFGMLGVEETWEVPGAGCGSLILGCVRIKVVSARGCPGEW